MSELVLLDGSTFFLTDKSGDAGALGAQGLFVSDVRHLSVWCLLVEGAPIRLLTGRNVDYFWGRVFGTLAEASVGSNPPISVTRDRLVSDAVHEDLVVENHSEQRHPIIVELRFGCDFADVFEVKAGSVLRGRTWTEARDKRVELWYERDGFRRGTIVTFSEPGDVGDSSVRFGVVLEPRASWRTCVEMWPVVDGREIRPRYSCETRDRAAVRSASQRWPESPPALESSASVVGETYRQSLEDLAALRFRPSEDVDGPLPAAGVPWFMTLFGRDSLITSYQVLPFQPGLARAALEALARAQATEMDDFRDAEPGKILHEVRRGKLAALGEWPDRYYGTHDATPLWLVLLDEYELWTGDVEFVRSLEPAARAALRWMDEHGDIDGDGYLEYRRRSSSGLVNHCWKDSWNSMLCADGSLAEAPIAACEIQGYAFDARRRAARLAAQIWGDERLSRRLESQATQLKDRFNDDFWSEERGCFVLALDGAKRQVDSTTSNVGHLLWSGVVRDERAARVAARLMADDMFSGWGIRTMSSGDGGYNPIEYHNGTVWPHDTAIVAEGLRRYGFRDDASRLAYALIEAAGEFAHRLPEVFAGFSRADTGAPVEYPTAARPQAWATGAPLLAMRTLLGLDIVDGRARWSAQLPPSVRDLCLRGVPVRGRREDVNA